MAANPVYAATPHVSGATTNSTQDTSLTAPTNTATVATGGTNGTKIEVVRVVQVITTAAAGCLNLFVYDGTTYHLWDIINYGITTLSATSELIPIEIPYDMLLLPSASWTLRVTNTVQSNTGGTSAATHHVTAMGGDY